MEPKTAEENLLQWMILNNIPFDAVECPAFYTFSSMFSKHKSHVSSKRMAGPGLDALFTESTRAIRDDLKECDHLALAIEGWTGNRKNLWSVTVFSINKKWKLVHHRLGCIPIFAPRHSSLRLYQDITKCLTGLGLDPKRVSSVTTDEGMAPRIAPRFHGSIEVRSMAHLLNTTLANAFKEIRATLPKVMLVMDSCEQIATYINHSVHHSEQIVDPKHANDPLLKLTQQGITSWKSWLGLFRSLKSSELSVVTLVHTNSKDIPSADFVLSNSLYVFSLLGLLIKILTFFERASNESRKVDCPTSFVVVAHTLLLQSQLTLIKLPDCHSEREVVSDVTLCLQIILKHLNDKIRFTDSDYICFALNPFYGHARPGTDLVTSWNAALDRGYQLIEEKLSEGEGMEAPIEEDSDESPESPSIFDSMIPEVTPREPPSITKEISRLRKRKSKPDRPVLEWWYWNASRLPRLAALARRYLAIPATQTASEHEFSHMRRVFVELGTKLGSEKIWKISIITPALAAYWVEREEKSTDMSQSHGKPSSNRILKLQKRLSSAGPNPTPRSLLTTFEAEDSFIDIQDEQSDEELLTLFESGSSLDFEEPPPKRRFEEADDVRITS